MMRAAWLLLLLSGPVFAADNQCTGPGMVPVGCFDPPRSADGRILWDGRYGALIAQPAVPPHSSTAPYHCSEHPDQRGCHKED